MAAQKPNPPKREQLFLDDHKVKIRNRWPVMKLVGRNDGQRNAPLLQCFLKLEYPV